MRNTAIITLVQLVDDLDPESAVRRMAPFFQEAADNGSDLIVFPEYILGRRVSADSPAVHQFRAMAKQHGLYAVAGLIETHDARWSTTALLIDRSGDLLGRYLKTHPAAGPAPHWWPPAPGNDDEARGILGGQFKVFHLDFGTVGILQCYDGYFPEAWACTSYAGAEVILWINGRQGLVQDAYCISAAHAHGCIVGATISNGRNTGFATPRGDFIDAQGEPEEMRLFPRIREEGDRAVHAEVKLNELRRHRKHLRTAHQRRPDLYGALSAPVTIWKDYPDIPWDHEGSAEFVNKAQLP